MTTDPIIKEHEDEIGRPLTQWETTVLLNSERSRREEPSIEEVLAEAYRRVM